MKVKIEADLVLNEKETLQAVAGALVRREVRELMEAFPPGEHFTMERPEGTIIITKG
jgi:hypothetical protein